MSAPAVNTGRTAGFCTSSLTQSTVRVRLSLARKASEAIESCRTGARPRRLPALAVSDTVSYAGCSAGRKADLRSAVSGVVVVIDADTQRGSAVDDTGS